MGLFSTIGGLIGTIGGPVGTAIGGSIGSLIDGKQQSDAAKRATQAQVDASDAQIAEWQRQYNQTRDDYEPWRQAGETALDAVMSLTGLPSGGGAPTPTGGGSFPLSVSTRANTMPGYDPAQRFGGMDNNSGGTWGGRGSSYHRRIIQPRYAGGSMIPLGHYNVGELNPERVFQNGSYTRTRQPRSMTGQQGYVAKGDLQPGKLQPGAVGSVFTPQENPGGQPGRYNFMTDPGYEFRTNEGLRALDRSAAARGSLLTGGHNKALIRYGQDYASNEYANIYNRIANIAQLGQTANAAIANAGANSTAGVTGAQGDAGYANASGYVGRANAWSNAGEQIAKLPWDSVFGPQINEIDTSTFPQRR